MGKKSKKEIIHNNLLKYRVWSNKTRAELAKELSMSIEQLSRIEKGQRYPKYQVRAKLCTYFNISQDQMFYKIIDEPTHDDCVAVC